MSTPKVSSNFGTLAAVRAAMQVKLQGSALTMADSKRLHLQPYTAQDVAQQLSTLPFHRAGMHIPYFDLQGRPTKFYRFRYLEYDNAHGFSALVHSNGNGPAKHDVRYVQPSNTLPQLYLPPIVDWRKVAKDCKQSIVVTEGELKAASACKHGIDCVGLGGVWSWKSGQQGVHLLPVFNEFKWQDRLVNICFDSDKDSNFNVVSAQNALAYELMNLGAIIYVSTLPSLQGKKTGLDDYIVQQGAEALKTEVLAQAEEWAASEALYRLNDEVVYVKDPGVILRLGNLQRIAPRAFVDHAYADRKWYQQVTVGQTAKTVERSAPKEWLRWPHRATVERVTYRPGEDKFLKSGEYNVWKGWGVSEPQEGDVTLWLQLLQFLFAGYEDSVDRLQWFQQWLAYPLQHPGTKLNQSVVMWSVHQGTGKSIVGYSMRELYGSWNFSEISDRNLQSGFNEWAENKQFCMGDEIASSGERKRDTADRMKSLITQRELRLNPKYVPSYTVPDCINYYFTSNHPDAFFMEDSDRRFFVNEVKGLPLGSAFYQQYGNWILNGARPGVPALMYHLLHLPMKNFDPAAHAPQTTSKSDMIESSRTDLAQWCARLREEPDAVLCAGGVVLQRQLWLVEELLQLYDPEQRGRVTQNGLARELKRAGFRRVRDGTQIRTVTRGIQRLWAIRNPAQLLVIQQPKRLAQIFDKEHEFLRKGKKF